MIVCYSYLIAAFLSGVYNLSTMLWSFSLYYLEENKLL